MPSKTVAVSPGLSSFLKSLKASKSQQVEPSIEYLTSLDRLLKRRQIRNSRPCAIATAYLLLRVVSQFRWTEVGQLIERVQKVGRRLCAAQPRELVVGNIVRRVLGLIREEAEDDRDVDASQFSDAGSETPGSSPHKDLSHSTERLPFSSTISPPTHGIVDSIESNVSDGESRSTEELSAEEELSQSRRPPLLTSHTSYATQNAAPMVQSMFSLLTQEGTPSPIPTPTGTQSPNLRSSLIAAHIAKLGRSTQRDLKPDIIGGIEEIIDELDQVDDQIAAYALEHIHSNEIILTHTSSLTVQKFLLKAATKRKFTVIHAESYPNDHEATYATIAGKSNKEDHDELGTEAFQKPLTAAGITVILIPDSGVFALMSRVNKVILGTHAVLANGGLVAASGAKTIAKAAQMHRTPVVIVSGVYKLSPVYPFDFEGLIEYGDASKIFGYEDGDLVQKVDVENPLFDYVPAELVDLYITNLGGHAPSYLYRIVSDHYRTEDISETEWSKTGQHTGISEIPLTAHGTAQVRATGKLVLGPGKLVDPAKLSHVYVSPRRRAQQTAALLCEAVEGEARSRGILDGKMTTEEDLTEWNYGRYEGLRLPEIIEDRKQRGLEREDRSWDIWQDGAEGGESPEQVKERMDRLIGQIKEPHRRLLSGEGSAGSGGADVLLSPISHRLGIDIIVDMGELRLAEHLLNPGRSVLQATSHHRPDFLKHHTHPPAMFRTGLTFALRRPWRSAPRLATPSKVATDTLFTPIPRFTPLQLRLLTTDTKAAIDKAIAAAPVVLFMKGTPETPQCGFSRASIQILGLQGVDPSKFTAFNVLEDEDLRQGIKEYSEWPTIPQLYVNSNFVGGCDILMSMHQNGELAKMLEDEKVLAEAEAEAEQPSQKSKT
ncbi:MAG: hypothetical protein M4579_006599 [Chaenotheca gracillima]|nr:MAG: hypothetical protein M4579_006599 [Chaenotheca gracillima]